MKRLLGTFLAVICLSTSIYSQIENCKRPLDSVRFIINQLNINDESKKFLTSLVNITEQIACDPSAPTFIQRKVLDLLNAKLEFLKKQSSTSAEDKGRLEQAQGQVGQAAGAVLKAAQNPPAPQQAGAPAPAGGCSVEILEIFKNREGAFYIVKRLRDLSPGDIVFLTANGKPPGGTYQWGVNPGDKANFTTDKDRLSFMPRESVEFTVVVQYTDPNGNICQDQIRLDARH